MPKPAQRRRRIAHAASRLRACRKGGVAVEFGLLAIPFLFCVLGSMDLLMVQLVSATLDAAVGNFARDVRTGQLQNQGGVTEATAQQMICSQIGWLSVGCDANLAVDVRVVPTFSTANPPTIVVNGKFTPANAQFNMGQQGDIVLVTVFFDFPTIAPVFDGLFQPLGNGTTVITSSTAFRNEPYEAS